MKKEVKILDGTPDKRLFWSIISDYDLKTAICELIDNAIDTWAKSKKTNLRINIVLDQNQQLIKVEDDAGGVSEEKLKNLIGPGNSENNPDDEVIGYFGVGSKRAVVAIAQLIHIRSRHKKNQTFQIDIDENWLKGDSWEMPAYQVEEIKPDTTIIDLFKLRVPLTNEDEIILDKHFSETYANFLIGKNVEIFLNGKSIKPIFFTNWSYPTSFEPKRFTSFLKTADGEKVELILEAGLVSEKEPGDQDYGVYFYCNQRLIQKEVKDRQVGYISGYAGIPHSDASLARTIVRLRGAAKHMPWNSSKSAINYGHNTFKAFEKFLVLIVKDYSSLSRRFKGKWDEVFSQSEGKVIDVAVSDIGHIEKTHFLDLPTIKKPQIEKLRTKNKKIINDKPWTLGLIEAIAAVELIQRQRFETKNRMALILLDSNFEIALKEFIIHRNDLDLGGRTLKKLFEDRGEVLKVVNQKVDLGYKEIEKAKHYYSLRNKLIHERATVDLPDSDIENYAKTIKKVLTLLFALMF